MTRANLTEGSPRLAAASERDAVDQRDVLMVSELQEQVERVIQPAKRRLKLSDLPRHAPVIRVVAGRDFKAKYKQSLLGPLWLVFQPVALLLGLLVAFRGLGKVQTSNEPYVVFALVGLSAWAFFQASLMIGAGSILNNWNFIRFTPISRPVFPIAATIASLPTLAVTAGAAVVGAALTGHLSVRALLLPLGLIWLVLLTLGVVGILSSLATRYRDVIQALPFLLMVGVFFAPIGYSLPGLSDPWRTLIELNPLTGLIEAWRWMLLSGYAPSLMPVVVSVVETTMIVIGGWLLFTRLEPTMADVV